MSQIVTMITKTYNVHAADTRRVLDKYHASLKLAMPQASLGGSYFFNVVGVDEKSEDAFIKEFGALKGIDFVYKKPADARP